LPENTYDDWVKAAQVYYSNLYRDATLSYLKLLLANESFLEGKSVCEKAISIDPFEEEYHLYYIKVLVALGQAKRARDHFEQANRKFVEELGFSLEINRQVFNEVSVTENYKKTRDLVAVQKELVHRETARGALHCDVDFFNVLCRLEARRVDRVGTPFGLATLTLGNSRGVVNLDSMRHSRERMAAVLQTTLRRGDVFTETTESQFSVLFHGLGYKNINRVLQRICDKFKQSDVPIGTTLKIKHKILQPIPKQSSLKGISN